MLRNLFEKERYDEKESLEKIGETIESGDYLEARNRDFLRHVPAVDFSEPENFAVYGSAELYYSASASHILNFFPYDGSLEEMEDFRERSSLLDLYVVDNLFPRTVGYGELVTNWDVAPTLEGTQNFQRIPAPEYIEVVGAMNVDNVYNPSVRQDINLKIDPFAGNTVELWISKREVSGDFTNGGREVIVDLWTDGLVEADPGYGRLTISVDTDGSLHLIYHADGASISGEILGGGAWAALVSTYTETNSYFDWVHLAVTMVQGQGSLDTEVFINGTRVSTTAFISPTITEETDSNMRMVVGGLAGDIQSQGLIKGDGALAAKIDEFRFWKEKRSASQIDNFKLKSVGGGTNTKLSNTNLGVYFKFNEGVTNDDSQDEIVLDYSGRVSNGFWNNYGTGLLPNRVEESAFSRSSYGEEETGSLIMNPANSNVVDFIDLYLEKGSLHDSQNYNTFYDYFPSYIPEKEEKEGSYTLRNLSHIYGTILDEFLIYTKTIPKLFHAEYVKRGERANPFIKNLLSSSGFALSDLFLDASLFEKYVDGTNNVNFQLSIEEIKNQLLTNLYNNASFINKTKGTEKAIRNTLNCLGLNQDIVRVNMYSLDGTRDIRENFSLRSDRKRYLNLTDVDRNEDVVVQYTSSTNKSAIEIDTSRGLTANLDVIFSEFSDYNYDLSVQADLLDTALFGFVTPLSVVGDTGFAVTPEDITVRVEREQFDLSRGRLVLESISHSFTLETPILENLYQNSRWSISIRIEHLEKPDQHLPFASDSQRVYFSGYRIEGGLEVDSFNLSEDILGAPNLFQEPKRFWIGAQYTDFKPPGGIIRKTNAKFYRFSIWADSLSEGDLRFIARDTDCVGRSEPERGAYGLNEATTIAKDETLIANWELGEGLEASTGVIADTSSPDLAGRYAVESTLKESHDAAISYMNPDLSSHISLEYPSITKLKEPDYVSMSDTISIVDDEVFTRDKKVVKNKISVEKSLQAVVSDEILKIFAGFQSFSNIIGSGINRFRMEYKELNLLRTLFFEDLEISQSFEEFFDFYRWIDTTFGEIVEKILPLSADAEVFANVIESHCLERRKYWSKPLLIKRRAGIVEGVAVGCRNFRKNWKFSHFPLSQLESDNCEYWKNDHLRDDIVLTVDAGGVIDQTREVIREAGEERGGSLCIEAQILEKFSKDFLKEDITLLSGKSGEILNIPKSYLSSEKDCDDDINPVRKRIVDFGLDYE